MAVIGSRAWCGSLHRRDPGCLAHAATEWLFRVP